MSVKIKWKHMIEEILKKGLHIDDRRTRVSYELLNQTYTFTPNDFATIREPVQFLSTFSDWIYPDIDEIKQVILETTQSPHYEYSYANRLFSYNEHVDQIAEYIIPLLKKSPDSRRAIMGFLNPSSDEQDSPSEKPGLVSIQFMYRENQLHLTAHIRSCDIFFGFPANLLQLHTILTHVCEKTNYKIGSLTVFCTSAHIFEDQKPYINKLIHAK